MTQTLYLYQTKYLVGWSLTSLFSTNMAISEMKTKYLFLNPNIKHPVTSNQW